MVWLLGVALTPTVFAAELSPAKLLAAGRVDDAILTLQGRISAAPNDAESQNLLCRAYLTLTNWDASIAACQKAVALSPQNSQYHLWLGRAYGEKADNSSFLSATLLAKKVRDEFETAVRLDPGNVEARSDLADFYVQAPGIIGGGIDKAANQAAAIGVSGSGAGSFGTGPNRREKQRSGRCRTRVSCRNPSQWRQAGNLDEPCPVLPPKQPVE